jgi:hypothetical protein
LKSSWEFHFAMTLCHVKSIARLFWWTLLLNGQKKDIDGWNITYIFNYTSTLIIITYILPTYYLPTYVLIIIDTLCTCYLFIFVTYIYIVANLALGSQPRQGVARLQAKRKTQESHHMLPRVQRVWGNEPSHSKVNSHVGSWKPKWTPKPLKHNCRGQNPSSLRVFYIIGKVLERKCLKWALISHLDI